MRATISVIIPTLNAEHDLPAALGSLAAGVRSGLVEEIIVVDGHSTDATCSVARAAGARWLQTKPGRGRQLQWGAEHAAAEWLLFLHADTVLSRGWTEVVEPHLGQDLAAYFQLAFNAPGVAPRIVAGWANLRSRLFGLPYGDQGLLVPRGLFERIGGYPPIPLMEDVAIARALRGRLVSLPAKATTSAVRYQREGWARRGARNLWTLVRYLAGQDPETLARQYRR